MIGREGQIAGQGRVRRFRFVAVRRRLRLVFLLRESHRRGDEQSGGSGRRGRRRRCGVTDLDGLVAAVGLHRALGEDGDEHENDDDEHEQREQTHAVQPDRIERGLLEERRG